MTALSTYLENKLLDHSLGTTSYTMPTGVFVALYTDDPTDADAGTEVSGSGYARQAVAFDTAASGSTANDAEITFTASGGSFGTVTHIGFRDAITSGNLLYHGALSNAKTIADGESLTVSVGDFIIGLE